MILSAIADDFAEGAELAGLFREGGARTVLLLGDADVPPGFDCSVACLRTRSLRSDEAVVRSIDALDRARSQHPRQVYCCYSSTFDSTLRGNIGPICDALLRETESRFTLAVPAAPLRGRTQYCGHLFVDGVLLNESPMRTHPLFPMKDANLVRWLQHQTARRVGLLPAVAAGVEIAFPDAISQADLDQLADEFAELPLLTGSSGLGGRLPAVWASRGWLTPSPVGELAAGRTLILAAGLAEPVGAGGPRIGVNLPALRADGESETKRVLKLARQHLRAGERAVIWAPSSDESEEVELLMGVVAATLTDEVSRLIVCGEATVMAVTAALGVEAAEVLGLLKPGAVAVRPLDGPEITLILTGSDFLLGGD